jgi:hypothetical protein
VADDPDPRGRDPHPWAPPDAGAAPDAAVGRPPPPAPTGPHGSGWAAPDPEGPPPPPWERARRRRRKVLLGVVAALVLLVPVALLVVATVGGDDTDEVAASPEDEDANDPDADGGEAAPTPGDQAPLEAPDLDRLEGPDAVFAQLLLDIDRSELAMIGFQDELRERFQEHAGGDDPAELLSALSDAGARGATDLEEARAALEEPAADVRADAVREVYLDHLDSWRRYMEAVEEDPTLLVAEGAGSRYTLSINATADAFARSLEEQLPDDVDGQVQLMAEQLLDRGFRPATDADV